MNWYPMIYPRPADWTDDNTGRLEAPPLVFNGFPTVGQIKFPMFDRPRRPEPDSPLAPEGIVLEYKPHSFGEYDPLDVFQVSRCDLAEVRRVVEASDIPIETVYKAAVLEHHIWLVPVEDAEEFEELCDTVFWCEEDGEGYFDDDVEGLEIPDYFIRIPRSWD